MTRAKATPLQTAVGQDEVSKRLDRIELALVELAKACAPFPYTAGGMALHVLQVLAGASGPANADPRTPRPRRVPTRRKTAT